MLRAAMSIRASILRVLLYWITIAAAAVVVATVLIAHRRGMPYWSTLAELLGVKLVVIPFATALIYSVGAAPALHLSGSRLETAPTPWLSKPRSIPAVFALEVLERTLTPAERVGRSVGITAPTGESIQFTPVLFPQADRRSLARAIRSLPGGPA